MKGTIHDINTISIGENSAINISIIDDNNKIINIVDKSFKPYFYIIIGKDDLESFKAEVSDNKILSFKIDDSKNNLVQIEKFVNHKLSNDELENNNYHILKVFFNNIKDLTNYRDCLKQKTYFKGKFEYDIPFSVRYAIDKDISPLKTYQISSDFEFKYIENRYNYDYLALDIETYGEQSNTDYTNPIIMISLYSNKLSKVICYKEGNNYPNYTVVVKNEKELIKEFIKTLKEESPHFIITYNGDNFDLPYIRKRAKLHKLEKELDSILEYKSQRTIKDNVCYTKDIGHIDAYKIISYLNKIGALDLDRLTLGEVYKSLFNKSKVPIEYSDFGKYYNDDNLRSKLIEYNLVDSIAVFEIANNFILQYIEMGQITSRSLEEISRMSSSNMVESILMHKSHKENKIIPSKPFEDIASIRDAQTYEGGFVLEPKIGLHENIAVLDFQSFHPSIIMTFNISPESLNLKSCKNKNVSPIGDEFCHDDTVTIPKMLEELLDLRIKIKETLKGLDKNSVEYKRLNAKQWSIKILLNSTYGYLGYQRARWYSIESARSVLKYTHKYIHYVIDNANKSGLNTIYSDTDSAFIIYKNEEEVFKFLDQTNKSLPGKLHLSLEGFYKRGLFTQKKHGVTAAKKRYALLSKDDRLKITGFEFVRRDWSNIAKNLQKQVLEIILKGADIKKAVDLVSNTINDLENGKVNKKDLVIMSRIRKDEEDYSSIGPHLAAAIKAKEKGYTFESGDNIEFIITSLGKSISDKAQIYEIAKDLDFDKEYYINNQIIPAIESIFSAVGYDNDKLLRKPKQNKLF